MENVFVMEEKLNIILKQMVFSNAAFLRLYRDFRFRDDLRQKGCKANSIT